MKKLALLLSLLYVGGAYAAGDKTGATFDELDTNQDGQVSAEEASQNPELAQMWNEVDQDASGTIDKAEFSAFESLSKEPAGGTGGMTE